MNRNPQHIIVGILKYTTIFLLLICSKTVSAQNYTLEYCIDKAIKQNIDVLISNNELKKSEMNLAESRWNFSPTVSANMNFNTTFGTVFDNVTFQRVQKTTHNSFPSLNLNMPIFEGFARVYQQKYYKYMSLAAGYENKQQQNSIIVNVTSSYISILTMMESEKIYQNRIKAIEDQFNRIKKQLELGDKSMADVFAVEAQLEKEKGELLNIQNQLQKNKMVLSQMLQDESILNGAPVNLNTEIILMDTVALKAENQFGFLSKKMQREATKFSSKVNLADFFPKLYLNAALASSYSSNGIFDYTTGQVTYPNYFNQLNQNTYQYIGFNLQLPLFNGFSKYYTFQRSLLDNKTALLNEEKSRQQLSLEIQQLNADIKTATMKMNINKNQLNAATEAFKQNERKYNLGDVDFYNYMNAMNARDQAAFDLQQMNYEWYLLHKRTELMQNN